MGGTWRGRAIAGATWLLVGLGCGEDPEPAAASATEGSGSSSGPALDDGTTAAPVLTACTPGQVRACYEGPPGTEGVGACAAGQQTCTADGAGWTACEGQALPAASERCDTPQDDDCDGLPVCEPALAWWHEIPGFVTRVVARQDGGVVMVGANGFDEFQGAWLEGLFVLELDAEGQRVWSFSSGSRSYAWPTALAIDAAGDVVLAGTYDGSPDLGGGPLPPIFGLGGFAARFTADGTPRWSRGVAGDGYVGIALGSDGTSYLVGGYLEGDGEPESPVGSVRVEAIAEDGTLAWILPGQGAWDEDNSSLVLSPAGDELWLVSMTGGAGISLGDSSIPATNAYQPLAVRIGLDGTPLDHRRLLDPRWPTYQIQAIPRAGGMLVGATTSQLDPDGGVEYGVLLMALDEAFEPVSERFLDGDTWLNGLAPYPDGTTLVRLDFGGVLELGPVGVGPSGTAIALVDDQGHARWIEMLYSPGSHAFSSVAAAPDGAVFVSGIVGDGGVLADVPLSGAFVAKLRP